MDLFLQEYAEKHKIAVCKVYDRRFVYVGKSCILCERNMEHKEDLHFVKTVYRSCENRVFVNEWVGEGIYVKDFS